MKRKKNPPNLQRTHQVPENEQDTSDDRLGYTHVCRSRYVSEHVVSEITGRAVQTLRNERSRKTGIPYVKASRSVRYNILDVMEYMESRKIKTEEPR